MSRPLHHRLFDALFYAWLRGKLPRHFRNVHLHGAERLAALPPDRPVLAFANHTNWWDLLLLYRLTREIPKACHGLMEAKHLRRYPFFGALGAFPVDLEGGRGAAGLRRALRLLDDPGNLVWIFPQGELRTPYEAVTVKPGLPFLARHAPQAVLLPVAFRYEFFRDDLPVALISVGQPLDGSSPDGAAWAAACQGEADFLQETARTRNLAGFKPLLPFRLPFNKKWEWAARAATGRLAGFDPAN